MFLDLRISDIIKGSIFLSKVQKRDYYFGAALSLLLSKNGDARPSLVECSESSCQYRMITDTSDDFHIYMKYTSYETNKQDERAWQFSLTDTDKRRIDKCIQSGLKTFIVFICGCENLSNGEIAVLTQKEYATLVHKTGIRIKLQGKSPKKYTIVDRKSNKTFFVDRNRFDYRLTDIKDSIL